MQSCPFPRRRGGGFAGWKRSNSANISEGISACKARDHQPRLPRRLSTTKKRAGDPKEIMGLEKSPQHYGGICGRRMNWVTDGQHGWKVADEYSRIDYILVESGVCFREVVGCWKSRGDRSVFWNEASDHRPGSPRSSPRIRNEAYLVALIAVLAVFLAKPVACSGGRCRGLAGDPRAGRRPAGAAEDPGSRVQTGSPTWRGRKEGSSPADHPAVDVCVFEGGYAFSPGFCKSARLRRFGQAAVTRGDALKNSKSRHPSSARTGVCQGRPAHAQPESREYRATR